jgi:hypothetical protein
MNIRIIWIANAANEIPDTRKSEISGANADIAPRKISWFNIRSISATATNGRKKRTNPFVVHKCDVSVRIGGAFSR